MITSFVVNNIYNARPPAPLFNVEAHKCLMPTPSGLSQHWTGGQGVWGAETSSTLEGGGRGSGELRLGACSTGEIDKSGCSYKYRDVKFFSRGRLVCWTVCGVGGHQESQVLRNRADAPQKCEPWCNPQNRPQNC